MREPLNDCVGGVIQKLREKQRLTVSELARKARVPKSFISRIEMDSGANVKISNLSKVADALGIRLWEMFKY